MPTTSSNRAKEIPNPDLDGIEYINIYSRGNTVLGRKLSHFTKSPFVHPVFGPFACMEGFWYYKRTSQPDDELRVLVGRAAKFYGRELPSAWYANFSEDILAANWQKIIQNEDIAELMVASSLPFKHFYLFGSKRIVITPPKLEWLVEGFEEIRMALKEGRPSIHWERAKERYDREAAAARS